MNAPNLIQIADLMQSLAGLISFAAYLPQIRTLHQRKSSEGMSQSAWMLWLLSWAFGLFYAGVQLHSTGEGLPLVFGAAVSTTLVAVLNVQIACYRAANPTAHRPVKLSLQAALHMIKW